MHALVCQGKGKYYVSAVFGYYNDDYKKRYDESQYDYWIVWDEEKKRLIRWLQFSPKSNYMHPQILNIDSTQENWELDAHGLGCADFLSKDLLDSFLDQEVQPEEILEKCRSMDAGYIYEETPEIKSQQDIDILELASWGFHDARISIEELQQDGTLYLRFDGIWGCDIEIWLWGDLEYDTSSRNPEENNPYWFAATIIQQDGFIYLIDEEAVKVEDINKGYCYFKARHMKYRIIPF